MREEDSDPQPGFALHLDFVPQTTRGKAADPETPDDKEAARKAQTDDIVALIQSHRERMEQARVSGEKYRVAVLGRSRSALAPVAQALRDAAIPFRAVDLEKLNDRPEVLDALALARALLNPQDRVAWLGVLRAPWCGLALDDLHRLTSADDKELRGRPIPELLAERLPLLSEMGTLAVGRVLDTLAAVPSLRASQPTAAPGTWL
jgi:ATP-dependent exoDNAse (exonuclease V) beta subunit